MDILQGIDIPASKKLCEKEDFWKIVQEDFFVPLSREFEMARCIYSHTLTDSVNPESLV